MVVLITMLSMLISATNWIRNTMNSREELFSNYWSTQKYSCLYIALDYNVNFGPDEQASFFIWVLHMFLCFL